MPKSPAQESAREDPRLTRLTGICLALPEATRQVHGSQASFSLRNKKFAYFLDNHRGGGIVALTCKVLPGDNTALSAANPKRLHIPAYLGPRGGVGLRLHAGAIDGKEVARAGDLELQAHRTETLRSSKIRLT